VDDTGIAHTRDRMVGAITNSILAANVVFGFPDEDRRTPCLNPFKWSPIATHTLRFLGYFIDTRTLTVQWPDEKHLQLAAMFDTDWLNPALGGKPNANSSPDCPVARASLARVPRVAAGLVSLPPPSVHVERRNSLAEAACDEAVVAYLQRPHPG